MRILPLKQDFIQSFRAIITENNRQIDTIFFAHFCHNFYKLINRDNTLGKHRFCHRHSKSVSYQVIIHFLFHIALSSLLPNTDVNSKPYADCRSL